MSQKEQEIESFCPASREEWRQWLQDNHGAKQAVWLVYYKINVGKPTISWSDAVDEALCFGWIDSIKKTRDEETFIQFFSRRKPQSGWSKINKEKVQRLMTEGLMAAAGYESMERAQQNGSWILLDEVETLSIPDDLEAALSKQPDARNYFLSQSKSVRKSMLQWIILANRPKTRQKRLEEIVSLAAQKLKPKQFR